MQNWHKWCITELLELDFHQSNMNSCFFIHDVKKIMLLLYINNIIVTSATLTNIFWFKKMLMRIFKVKNLREIQKVLDIQVTHNCKRRTLHLNQTHYINKVLKNLHIWSNKHKITAILLNKYDVLCSADLTD